MNGQNLLICLSYIDQKFIEESENNTVAGTNGIYKESNQLRKVFRKPLLIAAIVALMLFLMGCTYIVLSEADWFKSFFSEKMGQNLSDSQVFYINENTQELGQSVTVDGYTLTVISAIADERNAYIKLILQGPPGISLDADIYWYKNRPTIEGDGWEKNFYKVDEPDAIYGAGTWQMIDDENPNDNSVTIMYTLSQTINDEQNSFEPGVTYRLHITDLEGYYGEENRSILLTEDGVWDLDIVFDRINDSSVELITTPITTTYNDFSIEVTSFELQTMSAHALYTSYDDEKAIMCFIDSAVVLKDGTRVGFKPSSFSSTGKASFILSCPIILDDIDYVELRDGTRISIQ